MSSNTLSSTPSLGPLRESIAGSIIEPGDVGYDEAHSVWNAMIDKRPAAIVRPRGVADVVAAVRFAREASMEIAVRGGGHNVAGNALSDGGIVIDLAEMRAVHVDPDARRAVVQGGATLADYDRETQQFGLASTMGMISMTGVAGLTLGGGLGHLMRKHGLACDNLIGAQIVTATGDVLQVNEDSHADLLWALRGGGGNFGVVTSLHFKLHPVGPFIFGGISAFPAARAREVVPAYRDWVAQTDSTLGANLLFLTAPPLPFVPPEIQFTPIIAVAACWDGDLSRGDELVAPIRDLGPGIDLFGAMPYTALQQMFDAGHPAGRRNYWKSGYLQELDEAAIAALIRGTQAMSSPFSLVECQALGGVVDSFGPEHSAFGNREASFLYNIVAQWEDPAHDREQISWAREFFNEMETHGTGGVYVNYLTGEEGRQRVRAAYGEERYRRLVEVKQAYDPENVFHLNQNIQPATTAI